MSNMRLRTFYSAIGLCAVAALVAGCVSGPETTSAPKLPEPRVVVAAPTKIKRDVPEDEKKKTTRRTRRAASYKEAKEKARERLIELERRKAKVRRDKESAAKVTTQDVAERYERLLEMPGTPEERKSEILLRLAELSYEEEEGALKKAYEAGTEMDIMPGERYPRTIEYYQRLSEDYPESEQAMTAFYNLGYLLAEEGEMVLSAKAYGEVLRRDPDNPYVTEIHMRLGEAAFTIGIYREAEEHYLAVIGSGRTNYLHKARYKLGWTYYKMDDYSTAVEQFSLILDRKGGPPADLKEETIDVMGRCFVEWGGVEGLKGYLKDRIAADHYGDLLYLKLGVLYMEGSRFADAVKTFEQGVEAYNVTPVALEMEKGVINSNAALRDPEASNLRRRKWLDLYGPGTRWDIANSAKLANERDAMLEEGLRLAALYRHSRAQRGEGGLGAAIEIYERYKELYGIGTENAYEMAYSHAQALRENQDFIYSAQRYNVVAEHPEFTSHREEASYRRIEVLKVLFEQDKAAHFDEYVAAHERYVELNPSTDVVPELLFAIGELNFEAEKFPAARGGFDRVAQGYPDHTLAPEAMERIARCYFRENDFAQAELNARKVEEFNPSEETREQALKLISFSIFKLAEIAETEQRFEDAVKHFFRLAEEFPEGEAAQVSLYRGAEGLRSMGREEEAAAVYKKLADTYKESRYAESALTLSSEILSSLGDWQGVASNYEDLYRLEPEGPDAAKNLFRAAKAREKSKEYELAAKLFAEYIEAFPQDPKMAQAIYLESIAKRELGDEEGALAGFARAWETPAEGKEGIYRARAALALGESELAKFSAVKLSGDLAQAFTDKETYLEVALGHLVNAASLPFAETLAASLFRAGESFEQMKNDILDSERPEGFSEEELEEYQFLLEEKAFPLEDRAIEYYRRGIAASREAGVHNEWVDRMYARLEVLLPWAFQRSEQPTTSWLEPDYPRTGWERVQ